MTDGPESRRPFSRTGSDSHVEGLASRVLDVLAKRRDASADACVEKHVVALSNAVTARADSEHLRAIAELRGHGITAEELVDHYIPEVARRLGRRWCEDQMGFADVTIGTARLQALVRDSTNSPRKIGDRTHNAGVAVVVMADEFHTLGAMVLTSQLRRVGISVRVLMGYAEREILREMEQDRYDAVLISTSHTQGLDDVGKFVEKLRKQTNRNTPIAIGGPILETALDIKKVTGADVATAEVGEVIRLCRLTPISSDFAMSKGSG